MNDPKMCLRGTAVVTTFIRTLYQFVPAGAQASAIPSYARQTGFPCKSCHYMPPELTPLGRAFKLNGYTMAGKPTVTSPGKGNTSGLNILESFPLSVLFDTAFTSLKSPQPIVQNGAPRLQNGSFQFPEDASLFLAGAWATHVGSFVQVTYSSQNDHFTWDNSDIRYANSTKLFKKDFAYGITLNNNPTVEDLWNSTPAWGFPWVNSDWAPTPNAGAIINGGLAQDVAGVGGYAHVGQPPVSCRDGLPLGAHRRAAAKCGSGFSGNPLSINIRGVAPYWRLAWQQTSKNNYLEVGTYGIHVKSTPGGCQAASPAWKTDIRTGRPISSTIGPLPQFRGDVLSFRGTYIRENSSLLATFNNTGASFVQHHLNTTQVERGISLRRQVSATIGYFDVRRNSRSDYFSAGPRTGQCQRRPAKRRVHRQYLVVAGSEHRPHISIHGLYAFQWRRHKLRRSGTQCRLQQHSLFTRAVCFLRCSEKIAAN